ncbi:MAG: 4Fe-4S binding protein [Eubacteriales bacterium]
MKKGKLFPGNFRNGIQAFFAILSIYIGWQFYNYYRYLETSGMAGRAFRPPGVEAFIPLSSLVGLRAWLGTGTFDPVHPAGLAILLTAILISFLFRKSFCGWICPFGFLEELLAGVGGKIFSKRLAVPRWLDNLLRSLKYILLAFLVGSVFSMAAEAAVSFVDLPYNKIVDIKMLMFFLNISFKGLLVFGFLIFMSILFDHFWCRYLCPYGALMGLAGWLSPSSIKRNGELCVNCRACDKACPAHLKVSEVKTVLSPECNDCLNCTESCPVPGALENTFMGKPGRTKYVLPLAMLAVFAAAVAAAKVTGHWNSGVTLNEVSTLYRDIGNL